MKTSNIVQAILTIFIIANDCKGTYLLLKLKSVAKSGIKNLQTNVSYPNIQNKGGIFMILILEY